MNKEQERAFCIIANHACLKEPEQLKMYLGGMAGTGKSQVIKALTYFFAERDEEYRMICLAPTGAAAALINGSTYHSILGINPFNQNSGSVLNLAEIHELLKHVDYVFIDEVSMIDCWSLYNISRRMCQAMKIDDVPFGGINVIFAGDFAQLPPPGTGYALYSNEIEGCGVVHTTQSFRRQESSLGKALWHQFTTVVILRQNMRQKNQSVEDQQFRTCLENMRYAACTPSDIALLKRRVAGVGQLRPKLTDLNFHDVSIITKWNAYRDKIFIQCLQLTTCSV